MGQTSERVKNLTSKKNSRKPFTACMNIKTSENDYEKEGLNRDSNTRPLAFIAKIIFRT
jgi:hypothetical protein